MYRNKNYWVLDDGESPKTQYSDCNTSSLEPFRIEITIFQSFHLKLLSYIQLKVKLSL
jgi:hypothetical protein